MREYPFHIDLDVRVGDLNYGNHVGHEQYFLYFQEARMAYLKQLGYSETDIQGLSMVVAEASCRYKRELTLGDRFRVLCKVTEIKTKALIFGYAITCGERVCATGATTILCLDRGNKVASLPEAFIRAVNDFEAKP